MRVAAAFPTWTATQFADTTAFTSGAFQAIQGGVSTQRAEVREIYLGGQASASAPSFMVFGRDSTVGAATLTAGRLACIDPSSVLIANPPISFQVTSGAYPQRSATLGILLNLSFNAFGGIVRWYMGQDEVISLLGTSASFGELSLSAYTGSTSALLGSNIVLELI